MFGCVAAAVLALAVDLLLALMQAGIGRRSGARLALGLLGLVAIVVGALAPGFARPQATYVIGAKTFTEQYVLAALIKRQLAASGLSASQRQGLGSNVLFDALAANEVDVAVDYSGTIWANRMQRTDVPARDEVLRQTGAMASGEARHPPAGQARLRERLCAGDGAHRKRKRSASAASPISPATPASSPLPAIMSSSRGRNGRRWSRLMACNSAASVRCSPNSCIRRWRPVRST